MLELIGNLLCETEEKTQEIEKTREEIENRIKEIDKKISAQNGQTQELKTLQTEKDYLEQKLIEVASGFSVDSEKHCHFKTQGAGGYLSCQPTEVRRQIFHFEDRAFAEGTAIKTFNHGHLGVDLFFMLSGFVISYAYDDRWNSAHNRLTLKEFFKRRLIRLHPMLIMGAVIGLITFLLQGGVKWDGTPTPMSWSLVALVRFAFMSGRNRKTSPFSFL